MVRVGVVRFANYTNPNHFIQQRQYYRIQETSPEKYGQVDFEKKKLRNRNGIIHKIYFKKLKSHI